MDNWFGSDTGRRRFSFHLQASKNLTFLSVVAPVHTDHFQRYVFVFSGVTVSFGNLTTLDILDRRLKKRSNLKNR